MRTVIGAAQLPDGVRLRGDGGVVLGRMLLTMWFAARAGRFRLTQPRPSTSSRVLRSGVDPIRVLVTGAGLSAGYGVTTHEQGLAGSMASNLAAGSGRGVTVDLTAKPLMPAGSAVDRIGLVGAHTYRAAVFSPCYLEDAVLPGGGISRHGGEILQHLLATGGPLVQVVLIGVPRPSRFSRLNLAAARAADRTNRTLQDLAAEETRAVYVSPPDFGSVTDQRPFDAGYYDRLGASVAEALLPVLDRRH